VPPADRKNHYKIKTLINKRKTNRQEYALISEGTCNLPALVGLTLAVTGSLFILPFRWFAEPPPEALVSASTTLIETGESSFLHASPDNCYHKQ
jgi:hypothetical protein